MRRSPFQSNSIANQMEVERSYQHHQKKLRKIKAEDRKSADLLPNMIKAENSKARTRNFELQMEEMKHQKDNYKLMRKFLEIQQGRQLRVPVSDPEKNMEQIKQSPVHGMHSMHVYQKQNQSKEILLENINLLQRLEKVKGSIQASEHEKHWANVEEKRSRLSINRDSRAMLINDVNRRAMSQVMAGQINHSPSSRTKFLMTGQDTSKNGTSKPPETGMNENESQATLANIQSVQRIEASGMDRDSHGVVDEAIAEGAASAENISQDAQQINQPSEREMIEQQPQFHQTSAKELRKQQNERSFTKVKNMYSNPVKIEIQPHHNKITALSPNKKTLQNVGSQLSNGPMTAGSFAASLANLSDHDFALKRNSVPRNYAFAPGDPTLGMSPSGLINIDKTLDTYRTLKFDDQGIRRNARGPTIAEQYSKQATKMASIKKQQQMFRMGQYVPQLSGMSGLGAVGRTEDDEFIKQLGGIKASGSEENLRGESPRDMLPEIENGKNIGMQLQAETHNYQVANAQPHTTKARKQSIPPPINRNDSKYLIDGHFLATMQTGAHPSRYYVHYSNQKSPRTRKSPAGRDTAPESSPKKVQEKFGTHPELRRQQKAAIHNNPVALENFYRDLTYKQKVLQIRQRQVYKDDEMEANFTPEMATPAEQPHTTYPSGAINMQNKSTRSLQSKKRSVSKKNSTLSAKSSKKKTSALSVHKTETNVESKEEIVEATPKNQDTNQEPSQKEETPKAAQDDA